MRTYPVLICLGMALRLSAQVSGPAWTGYAHDAQHSGVSTVQSQPLNRIKWQTPVDRFLANTAGELFIHYGSPLVTANNSVIVPVRTESNNTYELDVFRSSDGALQYSLATDYILPPHNWIPPYGPVLSSRNRLYYAGAGGTVYYRDQPDSHTGASGQVVFYGKSLYIANRADFNNNVMVSTPLVADSSGNIYFGFRVLGPNPANLVSGVAKIDDKGTGSWVSAKAASGGDASINAVPLNCAPALSTDESLLYFAVSSGGVSGGYLVAVETRKLSPVAHVRLKDPKTGFDALLMDDSSAAPTVGPDGDVYYGVFESSCCVNNDRGWLLHFDRRLARQKIPGAFGWDTTASIVTSSLVASYKGASSYLVFTKYNNYSSTGGNGLNRIAILDPNASQKDPVSGSTTMKEVITILGPTPDGTGGAVREWCINSAAIDTHSKSAIANSEDGIVYRWDFGTNTLKQALRLTPGVGEAYTPTAIGADGTVYVINDAVLFAVGR